MTKPHEGIYAIPGDQGCFSLFEPDGKANFKEHYRPSHSGNYNAEGSLETYEDLIIIPRWSLAGHKLMPDKMKICNAQAQFFSYKQEEGGECILRKNSDGGWIRSKE